MARFRCPTCDREFESDENPAMPFCSNRCRTIDLGLWLDEQLGLPAERDPEDDEDGLEAY